MNYEIKRYKNLAISFSNDQVVRVSYATITGGSLFVIDILSYFNDFFDETKITDEMLDLFIFDYELKTGNKPYTFKFNIQ